METFEIEKDIPVPIKQNKGAPIKYPFSQMEIGNSFFIPNVSKSFSIHATVRNFNFKNHRNIKVMQRRERNGVRIWRIA